MTEFEIERVLQETLDTVGALVDNEILTDYEDNSLRWCQDHDCDDSYFLNMQLNYGEKDAVNIELRVWEENNHQFSCIQMYDRYEKETDSYLLPDLKEHLAKHPLFQFPWFDDGTECNYYFSQKHHLENIKEVYVALVLTVQDYLRFSRTLLQNY